MAIAPEVIRRAKMAHDYGQYYLAAQDGAGNVMSCGYVDKFAQARRIYKHYNLKALQQMGIEVRKTKYNPFELGHVGDTLKAREQAERDRVKRWNEEARKANEARTSN